MPRKQDDDDRPRRRRPADDDDDDRPDVRRKLRRDEEEDDDRPTIQRRRNLDNDDDRPRPRRRKKKAKAPQVGIVGSAAIALGVYAVLLYLTCFGPLAIIPAGGGLALGGYGVAVARKTNGRQSPIVPAIGLGLCILVTMLAIVSAPRAIRDFQAGYEDSMSRHENG